MARKWKPLKKTPAKLDLDTFIKRARKFSPALSRRQREEVPPEGRRPA